MSLSLNPSDIETLIKAVRTANRRGAFELEESVQILGPVSNLERWLQEIYTSRSNIEKEKYQGGYQPQTDGQGPKNKPKQGSAVPSKPKES